MMISTLFTHTLYITFIPLEPKLLVLSSEKECEGLPDPLSTYLSLFFKQGGQRLTLLSLETIDEIGLYELDSTINLMCCPELQVLSKSDFGKRLAQLYKWSEVLYAILILDVPHFVRDTVHLKQWFLKSSVIKQKTGTFYYPDLRYGDHVVPASIIVAALYEHNDRIYGILRCPSGTTLPLIPDVVPHLKLTNDETLGLNWVGINCIRYFASTGTVVWGRKTALGNDDYTNDWKYIFVVRVMHFISRAVLYYMNGYSSDGTSTVVDHPDIDALFEECYQKGFFLGESVKESVFINRVQKKNKATLYIGAKLLHKDQFIEWAIEES